MWLWGITVPNQFPVRKKNEAQKSWSLITKIKGTKGCLKEMLFKKKYLLLCVYVYTCHLVIMAHMCEGQRTTFRSSVFPATTSSGTNLGLASLGNKYFYFLRQAASPGNCFNSKKEKRKKCLNIHNTIYISNQYYLCSG